MCLLQFVFIAVTTVEVIKGGSSASLPEIPTHGDAKRGQILLKKSSTDRTTIPSNNQKTETFPKFLSFAFNIPPHKKIRSLYLKKRLGKYGKRTTNGTPLRINNETLQMVGEALQVPAPPKLKDTSNTGQSTGLALKSSNSHFEADEKYKGRQKTHMGAVSILPKKGNNGGNTSRSLPQFDHDEKDLVTTEITEKGLPLMPGAGSNSYGGMRYSDNDRKHDDKFAAKVNNSNNYPMNRYYPEYLAKGPKPVHEQEKHVSNAVQGKPPFSGTGSQNDGLYSFLKSVHNARTAPSLQKKKLPLAGQTGRIQVVSQGDQQTNESPSKGDFPNTRANYNSVHATSQNNLGNVSRESQEAIGGYGADDIANERVHPFPQVNDTDISLLKAPSQVKEQYQVTANFINGAGKKLRQGQYEEGHLAGTLNVQSSQIQNKQTSKEGNTERHGDNQEQYFLSQEPSNGPKEDQLHTLQKAENSNPRQNQKGFSVRYPLDDKNLPGLAQPAVQGYMPVDEFGSPFYGSETDDYFEREALMAHNRYRVIHKAPSLELDPQLSLEAKGLANHLAELGNARNEITRDGEGENVARGCSEWGGLTASGAVHRWYSQVCHYDWSKRTIQPKTKKFMQLIWKGTRKMGIGRALGTLHGLPCTFIVALYRPGKMNDSDVKSNIDKGLFLPSYCNADGDEGLLSTGYPSSFLPGGSQRSMLKQNDESPQNTPPLGSFQVAAAAEDTSGVAYVPLTSFVKDVDEQDMEGFLNEQPDMQAPDRFLPHISYVENPNNRVAMVVEDNGLKRDYEPKYQPVVLDESSSY